MNEIRKWNGNNGTFYHLVVWCDGLWSASGETIKRWNANGKCIKTLKGHSRSVRYLLVWKELLCSASCDKTIRVWNSNGKCLRILKGHTDWVHCLTSWKDFLVSGSFDTTIRVWNENGECITRWNNGEYVTQWDNGESRVDSMRVWNGMLCTTAFKENKIFIWSDFNQLHRVLRQDHPDTLLIHNGCLFAGTNEPLPIY